MRSRLFSHWFADFADKNKYAFLQSSIVDKECTENYFAIITRNDNPNFDDVMDECKSAIRFLVHPTNRVILSLCKLKSLNLK